MTQVGWVVLPLRLFLGVTMVYAGLLKFFDPNYLDPNSPNGVQRQMLASASTSPIGFLVSFTADHAALFGLTIAFGELAVGVGVLLGLWTRVAAIGGFLLSMSFFLTVSWGTDPYFFGPDIVFMFAFTPLVIGGDGGRYSLTALIKDTTRRKMRLTVPAPANESATGAATSTASSPRFASGASRSSGSGKPAGGVKIARAANVPVGGVKAFTNPSNNEPSYLLQPKAGTFLAYSAVCTHQGCTVGFDGASNQFACPCHGARFDGTSGDVRRGPARKPLAKINVVESNGVVYVV